jgi:hypothetical protein
VNNEELALHKAVTTLLDASGVVTSLLGGRVRTELIVAVVKPLDPGPAGPFMICAWERPVVTDLIDPQDMLGRYPRLLEALRKKVKDCAISSVADPSWDVLTRTWQTTGPGSFTDVGDGVRDLDQDMFGAAMNSIGVPGPVEAALVFVVPLSFFGPVGELTVLGDVLGLAFALTTGHALMACASLRSLASERIIQLFKQAIRQALDT